MEWIFAATPAAEGEVAGRWPWLRQGWALLCESPERPGASLVEPDLPALANVLVPGRFATFDRAGAEQLIALFELQRSPAI